MTAYLIYGLAALVLIGLIAWAPQEDSPAAGFHSYFVVLIGALLAIFGLGWLIRQLGFPELVLGEGFIFAFMGLGTAVGALTRLRPYWKVASIWPLFREMPERVRQGVLTIAGLLLLWLGVHGMALGRGALLDCQERYRLAPTGHDSLNVLGRIPAPELRAYNGAPPYSCGELLQLR